MSSSMAMVSTPDAKIQYNTHYKQILDLVMVLANTLKSIEPKDLQCLNSFDENGQNNYLPSTILSDLAKDGFLTQNMKHSKYYPTNPYTSSISKDELFKQINEHALKIYYGINSRFIRNARKTARLGPNCSLFQQTLRRKGVLHKVEGLHFVTEIEPTNNTPIKRFKRRTTIGESNTTIALNELGIDFEYDCTPPGFGKLRCDFVMKILEKNIIVEFDGIQHFKQVEIFGGEEGLSRTQRLDQKKNELAKTYSYHMLRLKYDTHPSMSDIKKSIQTFLKDVAESDEILYKMV